MVVLEQKPATQTLYWASVSGPIGACIMMATEDGVCWTGTPGTAADIGLAWVKRKLSIDRVVEGQKTGPLEQAVDELTRYLAVERLQFTCPLDLHGTAFQVAVWKELLRIPYGETRSYLEIARAIATDFRTHLNDHLVSLDLTGSLTLEAWVDPSTLNSPDSNWVAAVAKDHPNSSNDISCSATFDMARGYSCDRRLSKSGFSGSCPTAPATAAMPLSTSPGSSIRIPR